MLSCRLTKGLTPKIHAVWCHVKQASSHPSDSLFLCSSSSSFSFCVCVCVRSGCEDYETVKKEWILLQLKPIQPQIHIDPWTPFNQSTLGSVEVAIPPPPPFRPVLLPLGKTEQEPISTADCSFRQVFMCVTLAIVSMCVKKRKWMYFCHIFVSLPPIVCCWFGCVA